jgi:preprotein translocase subunit SecB
MVAGVKLTAGAGVVPVPVRATACGDPLALSATLTEAVNKPTAAGVNLIVIVQLALTATLVPQVFVCENEPALAPVIEIPDPAPLRLKAAVPVFLSVTACVAGEKPAAVLANVRVAGVKLTTGAVPVPLRVTFCGEPVALSATLTAAVNAPDATGVNFTVIVQLALTATLAPQVSVSENELELAPVIEIPNPAPLRLNAPVPVFLSVTAWVAADEPTAVLAKVRVAGVKLTAGTGVVPVPVRATACGDPLALSATLIEAVNKPTAAGVNFTVIVQLALTATELPQVFVCENELAPTPVMLMPCPVPFKLSAAVPVFLSVTACVAGDKPTAVPANVRVVGVKLTTGAVPVPFRVTFCGEPVALSATLTAAVNAPDATGVNFTVIVQLALAATLAPQVSVSEKEPELAPVIEIPNPAPLRLNAPVPVFLSVTAWVAADEPTAVLTKVRVAGVKLTAGTGVVPVPVRATACGDPLALSATLTEAVNKPTAAGVNLIVIVQLALTATELPQVFVCENELALAPVMLMPCPVPFRLSAAVPVFLSVTACVAGDKPTAVPANVRVAGVKLTAGALVAASVTGTNTMATATGASTVNHRV